MIHEQKERINNLSETLAKELSELKIFDIDEVTSKISLHFRFALSDLIDGLADEKNEEYNRLLNELNNPLNTGWQIRKIQDKLTLINQKRKHTNRVAFELKRINEYDALVALCRNKFGDDFIEEFYANRDSYIEFLRQNKIDELSKSALRKPNKQNG